LSALIVYLSLPLMSHLRWYWIVICSVSLLVTGCGGKKSAEVIRDESQKSVVLISHLKGYGSGFVIEGEAGVCTVLTAKHVVPKGADISLQTMMSKLPLKPLNIRRAENVDLAVVTFKPLDGNCLFPALKLGDSNHVGLEQKIYISSYPGGVNGQPPQQSFYPTNVSDKRSGGADGYEMGYKADTSGGTSGSPVLNDAGEVIALHGRSYIDKDSKSSGNDRAYLDLAIPINLYKGDRIAQGNIDKSKPDDSNHFFAEGLRKQKLGKNEEAISDYDRAIKLNPNDAAAYYNRGNAKSAQKLMAVSISSQIRVVIKQRSRSPNSQHPHELPMSSSRKTYNF
jgi:Trypsin-like peptidase domain/TPR repeat